MSELIVAPPPLSILKLPNYVTTCFIIKSLQSLTSVMVPVKYDSVMTIVESHIKFAYSANYETYKPGI